MFFNRSILLVGKQTFSMADISQILTHHDKDAPHIDRFKFHHYHPFLKNIGVERTKDSKSKETKTIFVWLDEKPIIVPEVSRVNKAYDENEFPYRIKKCDGTFRSTETVTLKTHNVKSKEVYQLLKVPWFRKEYHGRGCLTTNKPHPYEFIHMPYCDQIYKRDNGKLTLCVYGCQNIMIDGLTLEEQPYIESWMKDMTMHPLNRFGLFSNVNNHLQQQHELKSIDVRNHFTVFAKMATMALWHMWVEFQIRCFLSSNTELIPRNISQMFSAEILAERSGLYEKDCFRGPIEKIAISGSPLAFEDDDDDYDDNPPKYQVFKFVTTKDNIFFKNIWDSKMKDLFSDNLYNANPYLRDVEDHKDGYYFHFEIDGLLGYKFNPMLILNSNHANQLPIKLVKKYYNTQNYLDQEISAYMKMRNTESNTSLSIIENPNHTIDSPLNSTTVHHYGSPVQVTEIEALNLIQENTDNDSNTFPEKVIVFHQKENDLSNISPGQVTNIEALNLNSDLDYTDVENSKTKDLETIQVEISTNLLAEKSLAEIENGTPNLNKTGTSNQNYSKTIQENTDLNNIPGEISTNLSTHVKNICSTQDSLFTYSSYFNKLPIEREICSIPSTFPDDTNENENNSDRFFPSSSSLRSPNFDLHLEDLSYQEINTSTFKRKLDSQDTEISFTFPKSKKLKMQQSYIENADNLLENVLGNILLNDDIGKPLTTQSPNEEDEWNVTKKPQTVKNLNKVVSSSTNSLEDKSIEKINSLEMEKNISKPKKNKLNLRRTLRKVKNLSQLCSSKNDQEIEIESDEEKNSLQNLNKLVSSSTINEKEKSVQETNSQKVQNSPLNIKSKNKEIDDIQVTKKKINNKKSKEKIDSNSKYLQTSLTKQNECVDICSSQSQSSDVIIFSSQQKKKTLKQDQ